jgi:hypothetical protein
VSAALAWISNSACGSTTHRLATGQIEVFFCSLFDSLICERCTWPIWAIMSNLPCLMHAYEPPFEHHSSNAQTSSFQNSKDHVQSSQDTFQVPTDSFLKSVHKLIDFAVFMWEKIGWWFSFHVLGCSLNSKIGTHIFLKNTQIGKEQIKSYHL